jgi:recombination protein RecA
LDVGVEKGILTRTGTWYSYGDIRLGQGKENARQFLKNNPEVSQEVEAKIRALLNPDKADTGDADDGKSGKQGKK